MRMGPKKGSMNSKAAAAMEKKAANQAAKSAKVAAEQERAEAEAWKDGANNRKASRDAQAQAREDERRRRDAEKAKALADEEASTSGIPTVKKKKSKKKGEDVSALLAAGLKNAPKSKVKKQEEEKRRKKEEARKRQQAAEEANRDKPKDTFFTKPPIEENLNRLTLAEDQEVATSIDGAIGVLGSGSGTSEDAHPERRRKAAYKAFEEAQLPLVRADFPGLKLSQYKEKIFDMWKRSPENPMNAASEATNNK